MQAHPLGFSLLPRLLAAPEHDFFLNLRKLSSYAVLLELPPCAPELVEQHRFINTQALASASRVRRGLGLFDGDDSAAGVSRRGGRGGDFVGVCHCRRDGCTG